MLRTVGKTKGSQLTPKCKYLYSESVILTKQLRRAKKQCNNFKTRLRAATKFLDINISNRMTTAAAIFTNLQLRETHNKARGRRFTLEEKLLSLSLFKQSAKVINCCQNCLLCLVGKHYLVCCLEYL